MATEQRKKRPAVFFDRDGTLMDEVNFCNDPAQVRASPGMREALTRLRTSGWFAFIITNQSGIARGKISPLQYEAVQRELLRQVGDQIDASYFCPDLPEEASSRRKPNIGMVLEAVESFPVDLSRSYFVGDKAIDIQCGKHAGMQTILVTTGYGAQHIHCGADHTFEDAVAAVNFILEPVS